MNMIEVNSEAEDMKPRETADAKLGAWYPISFDYVLTLPSQVHLSKE